jgi:hypothetical protein
LGLKVTIHGRNRGSVRKMQDRTIAKFAWLGPVKEGR